MLDSTSEFAVCVADARDFRIFSAAAIALSTAEARTSLTACASARAILSSADLVRRSTDSVQALARLRRERLALALGLLEDGFRLVLGLAALALVVGEQGLRLVAQAARLVELLADGIGAGVERLPDHPGHAVIDDERR